MIKSNQEIAALLLQFADLLEVNGENPYKVRAYRRAAQSISALHEQISDLLAKNKDLTEINWVGKGIAASINHLLNNDELIIQANNSSSEGALELLPGLGKKRVGILKKHQIHNKEELMQAAESGQLTHLKWLNQKLLEKIKDNKLKYKKNSFIRLYHAFPMNKLLMDYLNQLPEVEWLESCGAFRRRQETFSEFCFLVLTKNFKRVADYVKRFHGVISIVAETDRDITLSLKTGINLQLIKVNLENKGSGLIYHTGSTEHVKQLEDYAKQQGFILNQKGLFKNKIYEAGSDEHEIYNALGLGYIEPELREARDEIKAAEKNCLPPLIELDDIKGDLHSHTNETDGKEPLERMIVAAIEKGYEYFAITDHSKRLSITNGLNEERLLKQVDQINELNLLYPSFKILKSIEVDILEDGALDLSNEVLKELDLRVCSIHSKFKLPEQQQTERIIRAMDNPYFNILGHATGRLLKSRPPYPINIEKILLAAKDRGCYLELNAQPYRLDINDHYCKLAKDIGVKVAISSDAHTIQQLNYMQLGIYQARRGWLEKKMCSIAFRGRSYSYY